MNVLSQLFGKKPKRASSVPPPGEKKEPLEARLRDLLHKVRATTGNSPDIIIREFALTQDKPVQAAIIYTDGLANVSDVMEALLIDMKEAWACTQQDTSRLPELLIQSILKIGEAVEIYDYSELFQAVLSGDTVVVVDGYAQAIAASTREWKERGISEPSSQTVIRGPRDGFTETLRTNTALVRRKIKDPYLWLDMFQIGRVTKTDVALMYIKGIANEKVVNEARERLQRICIDAILESGYIEEFIQDETFSPFPTVYNTERPDVVAAGLVEGRVAILVDGTPFVLLAPALFTHFIQSAEDYYQRADISTLIRILRYIALFISMLAPAAYIAVTTFHQEMIPTSLLIGLMAQREGIPFPAFIEAVLMELTFEILREAGVRMPRAIGQAVSIVGALVIGQAAVDAGLVGPAMVIIVSITAISNFVIPSFSMGISLRMIRFALMLLAASFGLFGILVGLIAMVLHLCSLRSFGIPYMAPFAPHIQEDQKDNIFRLPHWALLTRPRLTGQTNIVRGQSGAAPKSDDRTTN
ncbi:spore germination protein KA [Paenibacillus sp. UNCCL117]|uniref:spore germination protein n=1 Tax=unclassified Paenibacillus TaxID=185978 RepID=UPI00088DE440|nr:MULTISPECIES: spore germination protein [unclassified Paenibacillus]SDD39160.1 spore germination protein KA [Paenibacillus sp. cl123]SFW48429.1 spore germination protein KA [Paenibacillus sp. UNCCL117]